MSVLSVVFVVHKDVDRTVDGFEDIPHEVDEHLVGGQVILLRQCQLQVPGYRLSKRGQFGEDVDDAHTDDLGDETTLSVRDSQTVSGQL